MGRLRSVGSAITACVLLAASHARAGGQQTWPAHWAAPSGRAFNGTWRSKNPHRYLVARGDFNGDGVRDVAQLLVNESTHHVALWVALSKDDRTR
jgi:hypothetical protein